MSTTRVLHIGAAQGEIDFYANVGVGQLVYVEPDRQCLAALHSNINLIKQQLSSIDVQVIPKACSHTSNQILDFYANGSGQSSLEKPQSRTIQMVGDCFDRYTVETITLSDAKSSTFSNCFVDYLCVDTQGHEKSIICSSDPAFLSDNFGVIDVELMTDIGQYSVHPDNWKFVVQHLLASGFEPLVHPHGFTESYLFINSKLKPCRYSSIINLIREKHMQSFFTDSTGSSFAFDTAFYSSLGDHQFLPLSHVGGSIHASKLQNFREDFVSFYLRNLSLGFFSH